MDKIKAWFAKQNLLYIVFAFNVAPIVLGLALFFGGLPYFGMEVFSVGVVMVFVMILYVLPH